MLSREISALVYSNYLIIPKVSQRIRRYHRATRLSATRNSLGDPICHGRQLPIKPLPVYTTANTSIPITFNNIFTVSPFYIRFFTYTMAHRHMMICSVDDAGVASPI